MATQKHPHLCRDFVKGKCHHVNCRFEHSRELMETLTKRLENTVVSEDTLLIRTPKRPEKHDRQLSGGPMVVCEPFFRTGWCQHGKSCRYSHLRVTPTQVCKTPFIQHPTFCRHWLNGTCHWQGDCNFLHANIDPSSGHTADSLLAQQRCMISNDMVCRYWRHGACKNGAACRYTHLPLNRIITAPSLCGTEGQGQGLNAEIAHRPITQPRQGGPQLNAPPLTHKADPWFDGAKVAAVQKPSPSFPLGKAEERVCPDPGSLRPENTPQTGPVSSYRECAQQHAHWANVCHKFGIAFSEELADQAQKGWMPTSMQEIRTWVGKLFEEGVHSEPCVTPVSTSKPFPLST